MACLPWRRRREVTNQNGSVVFPDYRLIVVTAVDRSPDLGLTEAARAAEAGGATALQVRWKSSAAGELLRLTEQMLRAVDIPVYVNDRLDVALAAGAQGVHLGADDLEPGRVSVIAPGALRVGLSVGSAAEAEAASDADVHYWSIGPFNRTGTKPDAGSPLGVKGFRRLAGLAPAAVPVIAIGGICVDDIPQVVGAGGKGVAVVGAIFGAANIELATRRIRSELDDCLD